MNIPSAPVGDTAAKPLGVKRVLVADDHRLTCETIASTLESAGGFDVDWCFTADRLQGKLDSEAYDLVLLDTRLPDPIGIGFVKQVVTKVGDTPLLLLSEQAHKEFLTSAIDAGAAGVVEKTASVEVFKNVITIVLAGGQYVPARLVTERSECVDAETGLTSEEQIILAGAAEGYSDKMISLETNFKISHVKNKFLTARAKLNARNRAHAVMIAHERGII